MTKRLTILWIILIVQILLAILLWWPHQGGPASGQSLLHFMPAKVTSVTLTDGSNKNAKTLHLLKKNGSWVLANKHDFPADSGKVQQLLGKLKNLKQTLPVAVSSHAKTRFHVAKDKFEKKLTLKAADKKVLQLYIGSAAGANRVYMRLAGLSDIEANPLPARLLSTNSNNWRNEKLLYLSNKGLNKLTLPQVTLVQQKGKWQVAGAGQSSSKKKLDPKKTRALVNQLTHLNYLTVYGPADKQHPLTPSFKATVKRSGKQGGDTLTYVFAKVSHKNAKGKEDHVWKLTRSDVPFVFKVSADVASSLKEATAKALE